MRALAFFGALGSFLLAFQLGASSEVGPAEAEEFMREFAAMVEGIDAPGIFAHNALLAAPMFAPGAGAAWALFAAWSTGYAFAAIAAASPALAGQPALALLLLTPFGAMELCAYSLGASRSALLAAALLRRAPLARQARAAAAEGGAAAGLLLAAAYVEAWMIEALPGAPLPGDATV